MKFSFYVLIPAGIALAFFVMQYFTTTEGGSGAGMTREEIEAELSVQSFDALFELIEDRFPERMKAHRDQTLEIMSDPRLAQAHKGQQVMALNRDFTDTLRRENAALIAQAPEAILLELQQAELDVLHSVRADPELCTRLAAGGLAALSRFEQAALDQDKMRVMILTQFQAMVAGQDAPTPRAPPDEADWELFIKDWIATDAQAETAIRAFLDVRTDLPEAYCAGATSFYRQLLEDGSAGGVRIMAEYSKTVAGR